MLPDLEAAGIQGLGVVPERSNLVREVARHAPDLVICDVPLPDEALFKATQSIAEISSRPVLVFTTDSDTGHIGRAVESGIHAYVANGYGA